MKENVQYYVDWMADNQKYMATMQSVTPAVLLPILPVGLLMRSAGSLAVDVFLSERPADVVDFLQRMEAAGIQVVHGVISFRAPRPRSGGLVFGIHLGGGYGRGDIQAVIDGKAPTRQPKQARPGAAPQRVNLLIDIQEKMRQGKGPAYERWAKVYNLKQMATALQFLQEHGLTDYNALAERTMTAVGISGARSLHCACPGRKIHPRKYPKG